MESIPQADFGKKVGEMGLFALFRSALGAWMKQGVLHTKADAEADPVHLSAVFPVKAVDGFGVVVAVRLLPFLLGRSFCL